MPALAAQQFSPYLSPGALIPASMMTADPMSIPQILHTPLVSQKMPRTDRLEVSAFVLITYCTIPELYNLMFVDYGRYRCGCLRHADVEPGTRMSGIARATT